MDKYFSIVLIVVLLGANQCALAELHLNSTQRPRQVEATLEPLFNSVVMPYNSSHAADFGGAYGKFLSYPNFPQSNYAWTFNGIKLYSNIGAFVSEIAPLEDCKPDPDELVPGHECEWRRKRFSVCHLYMFNSQNLKLENVARLNIVRDKKQLLGLPRCHGVEAMAIAKIIPDAILITLSYIDSAAPAEARSDPPEFYTTILLRFHQENGKLQIEQDDTCLGNPNKYKTITAARAALTQCRGMRK